MGSVQEKQDRQGPVLHGMGSAVPRSHPSEEKPLQEVSFLGSSLFYEKLTSTLLLRVPPIS